MTATTRRDEILTFIKDNPGYHFRGVQRTLRVPTGVLQYHLHNLLKTQDIIERDINGTKCYFPSKTFVEEQFLILSHLRNNVRNKILKGLLDGHPKPPSLLLKELSVSAPTLSYHLTLLVDDGVLEKVMVERGNAYRIKDVELFKGLIIEYKESFADKLIQDFISIWSR